MSRARWIGASWCVLGLLGVSVEARAFCRTRTCEFRNVSCEEDDLTGCSTVGAFAYWPDACIRFAVQRDGSAKTSISAEQVLTLLEEGFRTWSEVTCPGGGTPELAAGAQGLIACDQVEFNCQEPDANTNLVTFRDDFVDGEGLRFGYIALTTVTASRVTGEIFDADIEINSRDETFAIEGTAPSGAGFPRDLRGVIHHELGHLLGLSHTRARGALMREAYEGTTVPGEDDIQGICEALGSGTEDPECSPPALDPEAACLGSDSSCRDLGTATSGSSGCSCRQAGAGPGHGGLAGWALGAVALWRRRRSQRRQRVL